MVSHCEILFQSIQHWNCIYTPSTHSTTPLAALERGLLVSGGLEMEHRKWRQQATDPRSPTELLMCWRAHVNMVADGNNGGAL